MSDVVPRALLIAASRRGIRRFSLVSISEWPSWRTVHEGGVTAPFLMGPLASWRPAVSWISRCKLSTCFRHCSIAPARGIPAPTEVGPCSHWRGAVSCPPCADSHRTPVPLCWEHAGDAGAAGTDWALGIQARSRALLSDGPAAESRYRAAIDHLARSRIAVHLARAHLLYGEWLRRENRRVDAREHLRAGYEMFSQCGAEAFAERARRELLATGETPRKRTAETREILSAQETQIADLAGDGYTNPQIGARLFISPRTVEWHLRKVFTKLGISSRRDLREALPQAAPAASG